MSKPIFPNLPTAPNKNDPGTFAIRADEFVAAMEPFGQSGNAVATFTEEQADYCEAVSGYVYHVSGVVMASSNFSGTYSAAVNYNIPTSVYYDGAYYMLIAETAGAGVGPPPSSGVYWKEITLGYSGASGLNGASGISGYSGSGISGYSGATGNSGFSGYVGATGNSGFSGYSGLSGYSGSAPENMATLDTVQTFTASKTFTNISMAGIVDCNNNSIQEIKTATFSSSPTTSATTGTIILNWTTSQNYYQNEPTGNITYRFTNPTGPCHLQLYIHSDGSSTNRTFTWQTAAGGALSIIWYGTTWAHTSNKKSIINFWYDGSIYHAMGSNQA